MDGHFRALPWYRKVGLMLLWPFVFPISVCAVAMFLIPLGCYAVVMNCVSELRVRSRMVRCGRYLRPRDLRRRIASDGGTLLVESPTLGWGVTRAWWTPDDVLGKSPHPQPTREDYRTTLTESKGTRCLEWDRWCWSNYTGLDSGRAMLVRVWNGRTLESKLMRDFPKLKVVNSWTALVHSPIPSGNTNG